MENPVMFCHPNTAMTSKNLEEAKKIACMINLAICFIKFVLILNFVNVMITPVPHTKSHQLAACLVRVHSTKKVINIILILDQVSRLN